MVSCGSPVHLGLYEPVMSSKATSGMSPECAAHSREAGPRTGNPGPGWPGKWRSCTHSGHRVSLWLPQSGHTPASWRSGNDSQLVVGLGHAVTFPGPPASQVPQSMERQDNSHGDTRAGCAGTGAGGKAGSSNPMGKSRGPSALRSPSVKG